MVKFKHFIAGTLVGVIAVGAALNVHAQLTGKKIDVLTGVNVFVDGVRFEPKDAYGNPIEIFTYQGNTYVPSEEIARRWGKAVHWDGMTQSLYLGTQTASSAPAGVAVPGQTQVAQHPQYQAPVATPPPPVGVTGSGYSRTNPAPINTIQTIKVDEWSSKFTATVRVMDVIRGEIAWQRIYENDKYAPLPEDGYEYILAKIAVSILSTENEGSVSVNSTSFDFYSSTNIEYESSWRKAPEHLEATMYAGGNIEGYLYCAVKKDDMFPKLVYELDYRGINGIWFALY